MLPAEDRRYRKAKLFPWLTPMQRTQFQYLKESQQVATLNLHQRVADAMAGLAGQPWFDEQREEMDRRLALGFATGNVKLLKEPHDAVVQRVEDCLLEQLQEYVSDEDLDMWRASLNIPRGKKRDILTFREKILVLFRAVSADRIPRAPNANPEPILSAVDVRNRFAHGRARLESVTLQMVTEALEKYVEFLREWDVPQLGTCGDGEGSV